MALIYVVFFVILSVLPVSAQQKASTGSVLVDDVIVVQAETRKVEEAEQEKKVLSNDNTFEQEVQAEVERLKSAPTEKLVDETAERLRRERVRAEALRRLAKEKDVDPDRNDARHLLQKEYDKGLKLSKSILDNNRRARLSGPSSCGGEFTKVLSSRVVADRHLGVSMTVSISNDSDRPYDIRVPTRGIGLAVKQLCPGASITLSITLSSLWGGSPYTSSRYTTSQMTYYMVADSKSADGEHVIGHEQIQFTLNSNDYEVEKTMLWFLGENTKTRSGLREVQSSPAPRREEPRRSAPAPRRPDVQEVMTIPRIPGF